MPWREMITTSSEVQCNVQIVVSTTKRRHLYVRYVSEIVRQSAFSQNIYHSHNLERMNPDSRPDPTSKWGITPFDRRARSTRNSLLASYYPKINETQREYFIDTGKSWLIEYPSRYMMA